MAKVSKRYWNKDKPDERSSWQADWMEQGKRRKRSNFKTKKEAEAWLAQKVNELSRGISQPQAHRVTVAELSEMFIEQNRKRVERGVIGYGHQQNIESHIYNYICRPSNWTLRSPGGRATTANETRRQDRSQHFQ